VEKKPNDEATTLLARVLEELAENPDFDLTEFLRPHGDLGPRIRERLRKLESAGLLKSSASADARDTANDRSCVRGPGLEDWLGGRSDADRYRIDGRLGRGGMGLVYRAWDQRLSRAVALKVSRDCPALEEGATIGHHGHDLLNRFVNEARIAARLNHPGIVPVHDIGATRKGHLFFVMQLIEGEDFSTVIHRVHDPEDTSWSLLRAVGVCAELTRIVAYAHDQGVLHRDLKPSNIRVGTYGEVRLMDWGVSRLDADASSPGEVEVLSEGAVATVFGQRMGTPAFMPPEQARGDNALVDERSDVYALGAVLYTLLAGHAPYSELVQGKDYSTSDSLLEFVANNAPRSARGVALPTAPLELCAIVEKAMARAPEERYGDMLALAEDLQAFLEGRVVRAHASGMAVEIRKWVARNRALSVALLAAVLLFAVAAPLSTYLWIRGERREARFRQLGAITNVAELIEDAEALWPPAPERLPAYEAWLERATEFEGMLPDLEANLAQVREQASSLHVVEAPEVRERIDELEEQIRHLDLLLAARVDGELVDVPVYEPLEGETRWKLRNRAEPVVTRFGPGDPEDRIQALAHARAAFEIWKAHQDESDTSPSPFLNILALAHFGLGLDDKALYYAKWSEEEADVGEQRLATMWHRALRTWIEHDRSPEGIAEARRLRSRLVEEREELVSRTKNVVYDFPPEESFSEWWHERILDLKSEIATLFERRSGLAAADAVHPEHGWSIPRRMAFCERLQEQTTSAGVPLSSWDEVAREIGADYGLELKPQVGLAPIGKDPDSGLWEFWLVASGEEPLRDDQGRLIMTERSGAVFVLLQGGDTYIGHQRIDPTAKYHDEYASDPGGVLHGIRLSPFFISKYELSQAQWRELSGSHAASYRPRSNWVLDETHPVESISWIQARATLNRFGLELPSEAQWEYAARAGTVTTWWTGSTPDSLAGAANVIDQTLVHSQSLWDRQSFPFDDGYVVHAPVDSFRPNPFGLHNVHGNVLELCLDSYDATFRLAVSGLDPVCLHESDSKVTRGGSFDTTGFGPTTSAASSTAKADAKSWLMGIRPVRAIQ